MSICAALALPDMAWSQAPGDANNDGVISRTDISAIVDHILGRVQASGNPDCNQDGAVDIRDAVCLINIVSSQPPPDPGDVAPPVDPTVATNLVRATIHDTKRGIKLGDTFGWCGL